MHSNFKYQMSKSQSYIEVVGARVHNLKNISVKIPHNKLTVITGLSGSGKSSLAFDTLFAEGQRRYVDTFSSYSRGYIGTMQRPDVDKITGLSPVISIDQKTTSKNPRSTVGTITEIYDYLRLLFARASVAYSYETGEKMIKYTDEEIVQLIQREYAGRKIMILAQLVNNRKGHYKELFDSIRKKGYLHVRVDGEVRELEQGMKVDRYSNHTIEVVVDRLRVDGDDNLHRLKDSVNTAMTHGGGVMMVLVLADTDTHEDQVRWFSRNLMCPSTGLAYQEPAPHTFSFNSPKGWCECCKGLGYLNEDAALDDFDNLNNETEDDNDNERERVLCPECEGKRLARESLSYRFGGKNIWELSSMDVVELKEFLQDIHPCESEDLPDTDKQITKKDWTVAEPILKEIGTRLEFMIQVGLGYLSLGRSSDSLSGGESQRIRLATQIGSRLVNVVYILDEPSIGLHQRDNERLIHSLKELRDMGNTIIVVEHDEQMMREADWIIDIGPGAGRLGGEVLFQGETEQMIRTSNTMTAQYLRNSDAEHSQELPPYQESEHTITLHGCRGNNLRNVTVSFPLGKMIGITGVSGGGKSTLINQTLYPILSQTFYRSLKKPLDYDSIEGIEFIDKVIAVDQSPIGRTPRSNPATYSNVFNDIRALFAELPESKIRGWKQGRFSFNAKGGRCEECGGNGYKTIQMHFLPDVYVPCEVCGGRRYNRQTLEVRFKGKNIFDVLDMTVNQAVEFFQNQPTILKKIRSIQDVGLGYVKLGQSSTTLSGGESQRLKLAAELARPNTGRTLYILDEPTTGLHFEDIRVLMGVLHKLVGKGNTVLIIEHNLDVIRQCDWLIDMGPEGGRGGGQVVAEGTVAQIQHNPSSITGRFL